MIRPSTLATAAAALLFSATGAFAASDQAFLKKAMEGDNSEMGLGRIAEQKGVSSGVREFGRMLSAEHGAAKSDVLPVAKAHGVASTDEMTPEAKAETAKLGRLSGPAFDREFASYMVKDHKKDIADFGKAARGGDRATADLARKTLPTLRKHLGVAEKLAR